MRLLRFKAVGDYKSNKWDQLDNKIVAVRRNEG